MTTTDLPDDAGEVLDPDDLGEIVPAPGDRAPVEPPGAFATPVGEEHGERGRMVVQHESLHIEYSAFPSPQMIRRLESALPGCGDRAMAMAEQEQRHRHLLERREQEFHWGSSKRGQIFAFLLCLALAGLGVLLIVKDYGIYGVVLLISDLCFLIYLMAREMNGNGAEVDPGNEEDAPEEQAGS